MMARASIRGPGAAAARDAARKRRAVTYVASVTAAACLVAAGAAHATSIDFGGRTWTTNDTDPNYDPSYTTATYSATMRGQWAQDANITTPLTLNVGDTISYDSKLLTTGGWFSDTGFGFIDNTGLYDSSHPFYHGGKVQRTNTSTWEFYAYDPTNTQQAYWYIPNNLGDNIHYDWTFDTSSHLTVTMTVAGNSPVSAGWSISSISDIKAFKAWLWDSQGTLNISNFKQRPSLLPASGITRTWTGTSGDYTSGANWSGGTAPTLADDAVIDNGGAATVSTAAASSSRAVNLDVANGTLNVQSGGELYAAKILRLGSGTSTGTVNQSGGLVSVDIDGGADLRIGFDAGATGRYNLDGGELWVADSLSVGQNGTGTMVMNGGWISHAGFFTVGNNPGANGTFIMHGGTVDQTFGDFEVGDEAVGNVTIDGGSFNVARKFWFSIGNRAAGTGTATIAGTAVINATSMIVGRNSTATATLNVNGGTINSILDSDNNGGDFWVGLDAHGVANITGGAINVADDFFVGGESAAGTGALSFTGGTLNVGDDFIIGHMADATATIGGTANVASCGWIVVGDEAGTTGSLTVNGGTINQSFGDLEVGDAGNGTFNLNGGTVTLFGHMYVSKQAGSNGVVNINGGSLTAQNIINNGTVNYTGGTLNIQAVEGTGTMIVGATRTLVADHVRQGILNVDGKVQIRPSGTDNGTSVVNALNIAGTTDNWSGQVDLANNDLVVHSSGASRQADVQRITNQLKQGLNASTNSNQALFWSGNGIITSNGWKGGSNYTGIGVIYNDFASVGQPSAPIYTSFSGQTVGINDVLVKYTYFGDADLNGQVNSSDYFQIDTGFLAGRTGWINGDFDYSGSINTNDYFLIDSAFLAQGSTILAPASLPAGVAAVPEPSAVTALAIGFIGFAFPRRRRTNARRET